SPWLISKEIPLSTSTPSNPFLMSFACSICMGSPSLTIVAETFFRYGKAAGDNAVHHQIEHAGDDKWGHNRGGGYPVGSHFQQFHNADDAGQRGILYQSDEFIAHRRDDPLDYL